MNLTVQQLYALQNMRLLELLTGQNKPMNQFTDDEIVGYEVQATDKRGKTRKSWRTLNHYRDLDTCRRAANESAESYHGKYTVKIIPVTGAQFRSTTQKQFNQPPAA